MKKTFYVLLSTAALIVSTALAADESPIWITIQANDGGYLYPSFTNTDRKTQDAYVPSNEGVASTIDALVLRENVGKKFKCSAQTHGFATSRSAPNPKKSGVLTIFSIRGCLESN